MGTFICIYIYIYMYLSLSIYIYIYVYIYIYICIHIRDLLLHEGVLLLEEGVALLGVVEAEREHLNICYFVDSESLPLGCGCSGGEGTPPETLKCLTPNPCS